MKAPFRSMAGFGALLGLALLAGCQRGGGGSSSSRNEQGLQLQEVYYGRLVDEGNGPRVVSPLTTVETDPVSGLVIPGTLAPLSPEIDINRLVAFGLSTAYSPRVVPRNCAFVMKFNHPINPASVTLDKVDAAGNVITSGNIQIRTQGTGLGIAVEATVKGDTIWLNPVLDNQVGFPASPVTFSSTGGAVASANGFLRLRFIDIDSLSDPNVPANILRSTSGLPLVRRPDRLGQRSTPIGFNPGNLVLDFIGQDQLIPTNETYNGFLPDRTAPRIVRSHVVTGTVDISSGTDSATNSSITDTAMSFSALARKGQGEWAGRLLTLRPGKANAEQRVVLSNTTNTLIVAEPFNLRPRDGDSYRLTRAEFFEPDLAHPIDPQLFDIDNPQNSRNSQLANFVAAYEIDDVGNVLRGPIDIRTEPLPTFSQLTVSFNEPMDINSFSPWESFRVARVPQPAGEETLAEILFSPDQRQATIRPVRREQNIGAPDTIEVVGWGRNVQTLKLELVTVPSVAFLQERLPTGQAVQAFLNKGIRGLTDVGGRALAFPTALFNPATPEIRYEEPFSSDEAATTMSPPPVIQDWGVLVHRFQGKPITGIDPDTGEAGVKFLDQKNYYTPIPDVNLGINGFLAGPPVTFVTKVHDDFFRPPDGQFGAFPQGIGAPLRSYRPGTSGTRMTYDGVRFQHIFRDVDASPSIDLAGTLLDLYQVSWSPIGGNVNLASYDGVSIYAAHSSYRPITRQNGAVAVEPRYGLGEPFDYDIWLESFASSLAPPEVAGLRCTATIDPNNPNNSQNEGPNYYVQPGNPTSGLMNVLTPSTYVVDAKNIYSITGSGNSWIPWPQFEQNFQYNNGEIPRNFATFRRDEVNKNITGGVLNPWKEKRTTAFLNEGGDSLLLEYRIPPQTGLVEGGNGFTFSVAILLTHFPFFRVFSVGGDLNNDGTISGNERLFPDDRVNDVRARCAAGPNFVNGGVPSIGDNSRYFTSFDYVKTTAIIRSPYVAVTRTNRALYYPPITYPPLSAQPGGTTTILEFDGHPNVSGLRDYVADISTENFKNFMSFRATFIGDQTSLLSPNFDWLVIPYIRQ